MYERGKSDSTRVVTKPSKVQASGPSQPFEVYFPSAEMTGAEAGSLTHIFRRTNNDVVA